MLFGLALLLHQFAREPLLQCDRQVEAGKFPGPVGERKLHAKLLVPRLSDRHHRAHFADAVVGIEIELPDIAERVEVEAPDAPGARPAPLRPAPLRIVSVIATGDISFSMNGSMNDVTAPTVNPVGSGRMPLSRA